MKHFKVYLSFFIFGMSLFCIAQDTITSPNSKDGLDSKKMVYSGESIYRFRLLAKSTELGKRTNNIELLRQVKDVRRNTGLQQGFGIAAFSTAIIAIGIFSVPFFHPTDNSDEAIKLFLISSALIPVRLFLVLPR